MKNRDNIIKEISKDSGFSQKDIRVVIESLEKVITNNLRNGETINFCGFGKLIGKVKPESDYVVPSTGKKMVIPEHKMIKFEPSANLKKNINE